MIRKQSQKRDLILSYMNNVKGHVSAEQVFHDLNQTHQVISLATVYRNLDILAEMHKIKKIAHPVNGYVYDKTCDPHYHLHCMRCDQLYDLPYPYMESLNQSMREQSGLAIRSHSLIFEGICESCAGKTEADTTKQTRR